MNKQWFNRQQDTLVTNTYTHTHTHTQTESHTHTHTEIIHLPSEREESVCIACSPILATALKYASLQTPKAVTHTHTHKWTHTHAQAHIHTHKHTYTHSHQSIQRKTMGYVFKKSCSNYSCLHERC